MKVLTILLTSVSLATSLSIPFRHLALAPREPEHSTVSLLTADLIGRSASEASTYLEKRRGGGGGSGGKGGGSSGSSSSGSSSSGGKSGSSGSSGSKGSGAPSSSTSSLSPTYGGGRYYYGGASSAYSSGARSPRGITPYLLGGAALGFFPGIWLYGAFAYPYSHPYSFHNATAPANQQNETLPVTCLCQEYSACGCDDSGNSTYIDSLVGNGSAQSLNTSLARIATVNGTKTLVINGTLPNGTDDSSSTSAAVRGVRQTLMEGTGFWLMGAVVGLIVWGL